MKILIQSINYVPELTGIGKYTGEMAEWLVARGHELRIVTAPPYYPFWKVASGYSCWRYGRERINGVDVRRCPLWVPARPTGPTRVIHLASFALSSLPVMLSQIFWRPDIVMTIEPPIICAPHAWLTARLSGAKAWLHIQDFEIEAFFGLGFGSSRSLRVLITSWERCLMSRFDMVSTISSSMQRKVHHLGVLQDRSTIVPNWVDTSKLHPGAQGKDLREEWGLSSVQPVVLYAGNMGKKQGLEIVLDVAEKMLVNNPAVRFVLVGEGAAKADLVAGAEKRKLTNILFRPLQPLENLPGLLTMADIHLVIQKRGVADAVMPSKLTGILASGGFSIITADQDTELGRLVDEHPGIAVRAEPEDADALAAAVQRILETVRGTGRINQVARKYAERTLDQQVILSELERRLIRLSGASAPLPS